MTTPTQDVLHLYLGCEVQTVDGVNGKLTGIVEQDSFNTEYPCRIKFTVSNQHDRHYCFDYNEVKPILRPLSDMTLEEMKELWQLVFGRPFHSNGRTVSFPAERRTPARKVMMSGVERLGVEQDGNVWYDSDLHNWRFNQHTVTFWLLSKHFDLFGLIDAGLAIDATTLNTKEAG